MSAEEFGFAPPPFKPEEALVQLRRSLRDLQLGERGNGVEKRGKRVLEWTLDADALHVKLARRLMATPEWDTLLLRNAADQRKLLDEVKRRLARWEREE
jgi:hypothetical protein